MYNYGDYYTSAADTATGILGFTGVLFFGMMIFSSIIGLISIISYAKIFTKAGKPWWACIVPIYNIIVMLEIAKLPVWYIALFFVPIANIYALFKINIEMAKKFGKEAGFGVGMTLLSIIFIPLLAFSDNKYEDDNIVSENVNNQFDANNVINNNISENNASLVAPIGNVTLENNPFAPVEESAPVEPAPISVEPMESTPVEPAPISVVPMESAPVEPAPISVAPMESAPVEPAPISVAPMESTPVEPASISVAPIESAPVEPAPINVEPMESTPVEPSVNAFNIAPETTIEPLVIETEPVMSEQLNANSSEIDLASNLAEDKKVCKNCGNELPDIVSICPNCGTDNE